MRPIHLALIASILFAAPTSQTQAESLTPSEEHVLLVCPTSNESGESKVEVTVKIDFRASIVNGQPAKISDTHVRWNVVGKSASDEFLFVLNRYTGFITVGTGIFPVLYTGQCKRQSKRIF